MSVHIRQDKHVDAHTNWHTNVVIISVEYLHYVAIEYSKSSLHGGLNVWVQNDCC